MDMRVSSILPFLMSGGSLCHFINLLHFFSLPLFCLFSLRSVSENLDMEVSASGFTHEMEDTLQEEV